MYFLVHCGPLKGLKAFLIASSFPSFPSHQPFPLQAEYHLSFQLNCSLQEFRVLYFSICPFGTISFWKFHLRQSFPEQNPLAQVQCEQHREVTLLLFPDQNAIAGAAPGPVGFLSVSLQYLSPVTCWEERQLLKDEEFLWKKSALLIRNSTRATQPQYFSSTTARGFPSKKRLGRTELPQKINLSI